MEVRFHPEARAELQKVSPAERQALVHAIEKLRALGAGLGYPHSSQVKGAGSLRELRPRGGRSPWRAFYARVGNVLIVAAIGPEAQVDSRGFTAAVAVATRRLGREERQQNWSHNAD